MTVLTEILSAERLAQILAGFADKRIGVIGDVALDAYWHADMTRSILSRETPHHPYPITCETYAPGAGGTVLRNLKSLGVGSVIAFSVLGKDWRGQILRDELSKLCIDGQSLIIADDRITPTYIKPILIGFDSRQEAARLDFGNPNPLSAAAESALLDALAAHWETLDALLIADQFRLNGIISESVRNALNQLAETHPDKIIIADSRHNIAHFHTMILKINAAEARATYLPIPNLESIGTQLRQKTARPVFITGGGDGVFAFAENSAEHIPPAPVTPPLDIVGAGDSFLAALGASLAAGASAWEAAAIGNLAAAISVEKINQTGDASPQEILDRYQIVANK